MEPILILLLKYKYLILFPLAAVEGPLIALVVGFLVYSGIFDFRIAFIVLLFGDIVPDTIYYFIGYFSDQSKFIQKHFLNSNFFAKHSMIVKRLWTEHTFKTMFFGKLAYGMAIPFLISAGIVKITYRRFIAYTLPISIFQYGLIMTIGYYMGNSYELALKYINYAYLLMAVLVVLLIFVYISITKYAKREIISMEKIHDHRK
ncbi:MAG: hypothetical protein WCT44_03025 [Candidatus Paceibacterota bacterium]